MGRASSATLAVFACVVAWNVGCSSADGPAAQLPGSMEVPGWVRSGPVTVCDSDSELYTQIDGGAAKYIEHNWRASAWTQYTQGTWTLSLAVHDMGTADFALSIFNFDLPVSHLDFAPNAVVDLGLDTAYAAKAHDGLYYIEASIDERSDAALSALERFVLVILAK